MNEEKENEFMKPRRVFSTSSPLIFAVTLIGVILLMGVLFRIENITVIGNEHYTAQEIINAIDIEEGDNLFFFDRFAAVSRVFAKLPYIEEVTVTRNLPNRVTIEVTESKAIAYIKLGSELWTLDHNCKILGNASEGEEETLIPVTGFDPGTFYIGETLTTANGETRPVEFLAAILQQIQDRGMTADVKEIDFSNVNKVLLKYTDKYQVILGDPYETEYKFSMVVAAVSQLKEGDIGIIDVSDARSAHFQPY